MLHITTIALHTAKNGARYVTYTIEGKGRACSFVPKRIIILSDACEWLCAQFGATFVGSVEFGAIRAALANGDFLPTHWDKVPGAEQYVFDMLRRSDKMHVRWYTSRTRRNTACPFSAERLFVYYMIPGCAPQLLFRVDAHKPTQEALFSALIGDAAEFAPDHHTVKNAHRLQYTRPFLSAELDALANGGVTSSKHRRTAGERVLAASFANR